MPENTTAIKAARALSEQAAHCGEMCAKENRPACAKVCRDTADLTKLLADFLARDAHGTVALTDAAMEMEVAEACATECEQHDVDHCRQTAKLAHAAVAAFGSETATTPRTPAGERL